MDLKSLAVSRDEVKAALAREREPWLRKRLLTLQALLDGRSVKEAARLNSVSVASAKRWRKWTALDGLKALLKRDHGVKQRNTLLPKIRSNAALRDQVAAALAVDHYPYIRRRLLAIQAVLDGDDVSVAARANHIPRTSLGRSLHLFHAEGLAGLLAHTHAIEPISRHDAIRSGLASPVGGRSNKKQLSRAARAAPGRGRSRKLNAAELQELRNHVLQRPEMSYGQLRDLVWARFHVRYSHASLKRLLKCEFGIEWTGSRKKLGEGLNFAELQAAATAGMDGRMKDKLKALLQLAKGGEAATVARANGVHLETLREWARRYRRSRIEGLRGRRPERDGRPSKLSPEQRETLREWIMAQPEIDEDALCALVKARFGVSYSAAHMRQLARAVRTPPARVGSR